MEVNDGEMTRLILECAKARDENAALKQIIEDCKRNEQVMLAGCKELQEKVERLERLLAVQERITNDWCSRFHAEVERIEELHHEVVKNEGVDNEHP